MIMLLGALAVVVFGLYCDLVHPEAFSGGGRLRLLTLIARLPPMWRTLSVVVLGVTVGSATLIFVVRWTDDEDDVILDSRGITEIGLFSRRFVRWRDVDQIVLDRRSRWQTKPLAPRMDFHLRGGSSIEIEAIFPGLAWLCRIGRARPTIMIGACDMTEAEIIAAIERFRPGILISDVR